MARHEIFSEIEQDSIFLIEGGPSKTELMFSLTVDLRHRPYRYPVIFWGKQLVAVTGKTGIPVIELHPQSFRELGQHLSGIKRHPYWEGVKLVEEKITFEVVIDSLKRERGLKGEQNGSFWMFEGRLIAFGHTRFKPFIAIEVKGGFSIQKRLGWLRVAKCSPGPVAMMTEKI